MSEFIIQYKPSIKGSFVSLKFNNKSKILDFLYIGMYYCETVLTAFRQNLDRKHSVLMISFLHVCNKHE